ncbi:hypothetical protein HYX19_04865 [Candidatus Woesearchaeota archaeon]|nr:hypothetical protein [Candidatus Woesearchaeota archaeon]
MTRIKDALSELRNTIIVIELFTNLLNAVLIFLALVFFSSLLKINTLYSLVVSVVFFVVYSAIRISNFNYYYIEQKFPHLSDELRAAADNMDESNWLVEVLHLDVITKLKLVIVSRFLDFKNIIYKMFAISVVSISVILIAYSGVSLPDFHLVLPKIIELPKLAIGALGGGEAAIIRGEGNESIYGNRSIAYLKPVEIKININQVSSETDPAKTSKAEQKDFKSGSPEDIQASPDASYEEDIPKENRKIVKNYFDELSR